jgi:hypothetical protein
MDKVKFKDIGGAMDVYAAEHPPAVRDWLVFAERLLLGRKCRVKVKHYIDKRGGVLFDYWSKKARVCKIDIRPTPDGPAECRVSIQGNHFPTSYCIVGELPDDMLVNLKNNRGCRPCKNPKTCLMSGRYYEFTHGGVEYICCGGGFCFKLNERSNFAIMTKWLENELRWAENDAEAYPEKIIIREKVSTYEKRWSKGSSAAPNNGGSTSVFELTNKEQRLVKPKIAAAVEYFIHDKALRETVSGLIKYLADLSVPPKWKSKNRYDFRYNKADLASIRLEGRDDFNVSILAFGWAEKRDNFMGFINSLPDDKKRFCVTAPSLQCRRCREICKVGVNFNVSDAGYTLCSRASFVAENPSGDDTEVIKRFVETGMEYIDYKRSKT